MSPNLHDLFVFRTSYPIGRRGFGLADFNQSSVIDVELDSNPSQELVPVTTLCSYFPKLPPPGMTDPFYLRDPYKRRSHATLKPAPPSICHPRTARALRRTPLSRSDRREIYRLPFSLTALLICLLCNCRRKNRGRRSRKRASNPDHHSCRWDRSSAHEPLLATSCDSLTSDGLCQTIQDADFPATGSFTTPVKGHQRISVGFQNDIFSPEADRAPFRPLDVTTNGSRPSFLSPLYSPRKPHNTRVAKPVRAMMDIFLDPRARSDVENESDDEPFGGIGRRLRFGKHMSTPESPTPSSSRTNSQERDSVFSTPTRGSKHSSPGRSPRRGLGLYLWRGQGCQESPSKPTTAFRTDESWTLPAQRDGFWRREAERLRMCAPKILLPSWHLGLAGREDGEDTERLMTLANVSLAELEPETSELDLDPSEHRGFEVSDDRSTANWL